MEGSLLDAIDQLKAVLEGNPSDAVALKQLTSLYWRSNQLDQASECLERLLVQEPGNAHIWNSRAICLTAIGKADEAIPCFQEAARLEPSTASFQQNLGRAFLDTGHWQEASEAFRRALILEPDSVEAQEGMAQARARMSEEQVQGSASPLSFEERLAKASSLYDLDQVGQAGEEVDRLVDEGYITPNSLLLKGMVLAMKGRHGEALDLIWRAIDLDPDSFESYFYLMESLKIDESHRPLVARMEELTRSPQGTDSDRSKIYFALGRAYDQLREYELAMSRFDEANRLARQTLPSEFDQHELVKDVDDLIATFDRARLNSRQDYAVDSELPVLIVGLPRSGTTLVESILSRHPKAVAAGELRFWGNQIGKAYTSRARAVHAKEASDLGAEYLRLLESIGGGADRVIDKNPFNYQRVGLIGSVLPRARFIHCKRSPVDCCLSFYMASILSPPSYAFDKRNIILNYRQYRRLTDHWRTVIPSARWLEVQYEELIADQEAVTRTMLEFCGLEWSDQCLRPQDSDRIIASSSHWQARQPVYKTSVERWRRYEPWLGEFRELLSE